MLTFQTNNETVLDGQVRFVLVVNHNPFCHNRWPLSMLHKARFDHRVK